MERTKQIFILSGQSNMAGRGGVFEVNNEKRWDGIVPPQSAPDPTKIKRLSAQLIWEEACPPLHYDIDDKLTCGLGPGMSFANVVKHYIEGVIGLVPCAVGGTAIKEWAKGEKYYENMINRAKVACAGGGGEIKALLWYQGESDTKSQDDAESYKANMENLIYNVRADLHLPSLPIIQVALASGYEKEYIEIVREAQKGINVYNVVCVDAKGSELEEDNLHLTTKAQVELGFVLSTAYLATQQICSSSALP